MQGHYLLGLRILNLLVTEMNQPTQGRTLTQHRKLAVAFRDNALLKVFQLAIGSLRTLAPPAQCSSKLQEQVDHNPYLPIPFPQAFHNFREYFFMLRPASLSKRDMLSLGADTARVSAEERSTYPQASMHLMCPLLNACIFTLHRVDDFLRGGLVGT